VVESRVRSSTNQLKKKIRYFSDQDRVFRLGSQKYHNTRAFLCKKMAEKCWRIILKRSWKRKGGRSYPLLRYFVLFHSRNLVPSAKIDTFSCNAQENLELQGKIPKESNEARHEELRKCIQKTLSTLNLQNCEWQYLYLETCLASWGGQNDRLLDPVWWGRRAGWAPARTEPPGGTNKVTASFPTITRAVERNFRAQYLYQYCMYGRYPFSKSGPTKKRFRKQSPAMFQVSRLWRRKPNFFSQGEHNANKPGFGSRWWGARLEP